MCKVVGAFLLVLLPIVLAHPAQDELMLDLGDDTAVVESTVREARAAVPDHIEDLLQPGVKQAYLHTFGDKEGADGDVQGYRKKTHDKGSDGYKHFDSYHKKDGDKYGYEVHSEYGQEHKAEAGASNKKEKVAKGYGKISDDEAESKKSYKVVEDEGKKAYKAVEDYEGDSGYYADSGDSEGYTEAENYSEGGEAEVEAEAGEGDVGYYEGGADEGDADSGHYVAEEGDNESYSEYDDGESEAYTEAEEDDY